MAKLYRREGNAPEDAWNELIRRVNELAEECGYDTLELTEPNYIWNKPDIKEVQDKLIEICDDNEFDAIPDLWKQSIVDELVEALDRGCCDCPIDRDDFPNLRTFETQGGYKLLQGINAEGVWAMFDWAGWIMQETEPLTIETIPCTDENGEEYTIERRMGGRGWMGRQYVKWQMFMYNDGTEVIEPIREGDLIDGYIDIGEGQWTPEPECGEAPAEGTPLGADDPAWRFEWTTEFRTGQGFFVIGQDGTEIGPVTSITNKEEFLDPTIPSSPYTLQTSKGGEPFGLKIFLRLFCEGQA